MLCKCLVQQESSWLIQASIDFHRTSMDIKQCYGVTFLDFPNVFRPNWIRKLIKFWLWNKSVVWVCCVCCSKNESSISQQLLSQRKVMGESVFGQVCIMWHCHDIVWPICVVCFKPWRCSCGQSLLGRQLAHELCHENMYKEKSRPALPLNYLILLHGRFGQDALL